MPTHNFSDHAKAAEWLTGQGFRHENIADVWVGLDDHTLAYVVSTILPKVQVNVTVNVTVNRTNEPR